MMFLITYVGLFLPFVLGFGIDDLPKEFDIANIAVEILLITDIGMNFRFAFENKDTGIISMSRKEIALHYLRTWLIVDVIASFPFFLTMHVVPSLLLAGQTFRFVQLL